MMLSDEVQLGFALQAFGNASGLGPFWASQFHLYLTKAGINSMSVLATGCREETVNMDLEFIGVTEKLSDKTIKQLLIFLPGPMGYRCFRLAQMAAKKVKAGEADAKYIHRPENGMKGDEVFKINHEGSWKLHVDCAGFVRSTLQHVTKDKKFVLALSDRSFMRAKDFYRFFETVPYSVTDSDILQETDMRMQWRLVRDLRLVIPGDIIVYRPKGSAAGGAAFTTNDRSDLRHLLKAVKTAEIWHQEEEEWKNLVSRNVCRDPAVKTWVDATRNKLANIGIFTVKDLRSKMGSVNDMLQKAGEDPLSSKMLRLMNECANTQALNTGHIVFASGPAELKGDSEYRIRVVHSTKYGVPDNKGNTTEGVQEYFKRFHLVTGPNGEERWTREMKKAPAESEARDDGDTDDEDLDYDDDDDLNDTTSDDSTQDKEMEEAGDDLAGAVNVEVLAARMCF
ncbi:expressed unknown protein [Seminavis robusta]|uniref:Uncharacterized protein n=1 Tax=Seminavis robusta TaxID=568900 RepID=A0A9N8E0C0_9STRA|nr:expressed unknown protein [Seminavis robusta]|eukprot:Sro436_g142560.1 n/a (453) ;mRNA; f:14109-15553